MSEPMCMSSSAPLTWRVLRLCKTCLMPFRVSTDLLFNLLPCILNRAIPSVLIVTNTLCNLFFTGSYSMLRFSLVTAFPSVFSCWRLIFFVLSRNSSIFLNVLDYDVISLGRDADFSITL